MDIRLLVDLIKIKEVSFYLWKLKEYKPEGPHHIMYCDFVIEAHDTNRVLYNRTILEISETEVEYITAGDGRIVLNDGSDSYIFTSGESVTLVQNYFIPLLTKSGIIQRIRDKVANSKEVYIVETGDEPMIKEVRDGSYKPSL